MQVSYLDRYVTSAICHRARLTPLLGSDQEKTFGPTISGLIHRHIGPERLLLWDSKQRGGRPDTMKILKEAYDYWKAEGTPPSRLSSETKNLLTSTPVVFITSNYIGNFEIQHGCKALGIPAFGTLWDFVSPADHSNYPQLHLRFLSDFSCMFPGGQYLLSGPSVVNRTLHMMALNPLISYFTW